LGAASAAAARVAALVTELVAMGDVLFLIEKPASVPSHAGGCYLANALLPMVEAQLGLPPR